MPPCSNKSSALFGINENALKFGTSQASSIGFALDIYNPYKQTPQHQEHKPYRSILRANLGNNQASTYTPTWALGK